MPFAISNACTRVIFTGQLSLLVAVLILLPSITGGGGQSWRVCSWPSQQ